MPETIPEAVSVSGEAVVDVTARIYSLASRMFLAENAGLGEELDEIGSRVLHMAFPDDEYPQFPDSHLSDVANVRSDALTAEWANQFAGKAIRAMARA